MFKVQFLSVLNPGMWLDANWLGIFSTERRANNSGRHEFEGRSEWRVVKA